MQDQDGKMAGAVMDGSLEPVGQVASAGADDVEQVAQAAFESEYRDAALVAARAADSKKAVDIIVQEVGPLIGIADYFVMATASNPRQADAVIDEVEDCLREEAGLKPVNRELSRDGSWSLLDYGALVVHVFLPESREYYRLEQLWPDAELVDLASEEGFENLEYTDRISMVVGA